MIVQRQPKIHQKAKRIHDPIKIRFKRFCHTQNICDNSKNDIT